MTITIRPLSTIKFIGLSETNTIGYYAAYGAARNHARDHEGYSPVPTGRDHRLVAAHYLAGATRTHHKIGRVLERLLLERHRADYQDDISQPLRPLAQLAVQESHQVFTLLQQLLP